MNVIVQMVKIVVLIHSRAAEDKDLGGDQTNKVGFRLILYQDKGDYNGADDDDCSGDTIEGCPIEIPQG